MSAQTARRLGAGMKLGFVGPADGDRELLREALELLVSDVAVDQAIYLGLDDLVDEVVEGWASQIVGGQSFLDRAVAIARNGTPHDVDELLARDAAVERLSCIRRLPAAPARAVEMIEDRFVTAVYDKAVLDEEDIVNSTLLVYGKSEEAVLRRFGTRYFFTPGPLRGGKVGVVEAENDGQVVVATFAPSGAPIWRETLKARATTKVVVSS